MARRPAHRDALVTTAVRLFRRQGYAATGLQQLLDVSGAPKGSLYHYFPGGKEEIAVAAVERAGAQVLEMIEGLAGAHRSPAAFVRAYVRRYADWMQASGYRSGCPIATTLLELSPESRAVTRAGRAAISSWVEAIARVLSREGVGTRRARQESEALVAALEGALLLARVTRSTAPILNVGTTAGRRLSA